MKRVKTTGWSTFRKSMLFLMFVSVMTFTSIPGYSQTKKNVTGIVKDAETGEPLIGVGIKVKDINYADLGRRWYLYIFIVISVIVPLSRSAIMLRFHLPDSKDNIDINP